ncbi:NAD(P)-binding domain-containing protein [Pseudomonas sp. ANT_H12B]|uniref:NAD(P)-binding domain-containing protein n=1 Tax=Pseudomonas sp. ANT_H12B TaxID=2597348 RepID=UPI0021160057|nr:NAD(P)-binding domain-containing protein [Pseudomonas sp. ANT_H12B]
MALGTNGIVEGTAVRTLVDLSTVGSRAEQEVAAGLFTSGIETVDAPVSGGAAGAQKGPKNPVDEAGFFH